METEVAKLVKRQYVQWRIVYNHMVKEVNSEVTGAPVDTDSVLSSSSEEGVVTPSVDVEGDDWLFFSDL